MDAHRLKLLQNMPIFSALNESALEFIERHCETRTILLGDPVFLEGDPASSLFILESGEAEVLKTCDPDLRRLSYLNPGDCFGEMAIRKVWRRARFSGCWVSLPSSSLTRSMVA